MVFACPLRDILLKFGLPKAMQVAILVHRQRLGSAGAYLCHGFVLQVDADTALVGLHIDEGDVVLGHHGMVHAAHLDAQTAVLQGCNHGYVLLLTCIHGVRYQFLHLLAAAYYGNAGVNHLYYHIATYRAFIKFRCHNLFFFWWFNIWNLSLIPIQRYDNFAYLCL